MVPFSLLEEGPFVWGGCMAFRADDLRTDRVGLIQGWLEGGYSDDLLVTSTCGERQLRIQSPKSAIFAQLVGPCDFWAFINYLYRQLYVLDTYCTPAGRKLNLVLAFVHCYLSSVYVTAYISAAIVCCLGAYRLLSSSRVLDLIFAMDTAAARTLPSLVSARNISLGKSLIATLAPEIRTLRLPAAMWASTWLVSLGQRVLVGGAMSLLDALHPGAGTAQRSSFNFGLLWFGFIFMNAVLPPLVLAVLFGANTVNWSGIRYMKREGKVHRIS